ncbi:hypothetical protein V1389_04490 [Flavobacterium rakeshii]|uniref:hypothetical protein n=1 Tax=Flavobacterium rakeshii TaxID=1038845 RepID=UPI002E7B6BDD|nr:hypothetical protein [Flavobacterium rakeshii]MEE1897580.1 hypothetical protein [Flavobacterium rakeshii]
MDLQEYFQSFNYYFWEWDKEIHSESSVFESVTIVDGSTIAYEPYIIEVLEYLAEESIPPFGSLLLVIIATNHDPVVSLKKISDIVTQSFSITKGAASEEWSNGAFTFLKKFIALPQLYKTGSKRKQLLQTVFSGCHNRLSKDKAQAIITEYKNHRHHLVKCAQKIPPSYAVFQKDFRTLSLLNDTFPDTQTILKAIEDLPVVNEIANDVEEKGIVKEQPDLLTQLTQNETTFTVGSLIKTLWSGLTIPMHHYASGRQPLGGVSDLTNKGDFSRLLLSEFANDDDVFMSRLANNEALYIEREVPPENDTFFRAILIDASIRNWGTPKVLSFAMGLAIATHPKTDIECRLFVISDTFNEVLYTTVDEVIDGLEVLSPEMSAATGFKAFFESDIMAFSPEVFVITTPDAQKVPALQQVLSEYYSNLHFIVEPDFSGCIDFYKIVNKGRKLIQHLKLPLEELWQNKPKFSSYNKKRKEKKREVNVDYPLLFPLPQQEIARFFLDDYIYILTPNRSLYKTYSFESERRGGYWHEGTYIEEKGCDIVLENLSVKAGGIHTLGKINDNYIMVSFYNKECYVSYHNLNTAEFYKTDLVMVQNGNYKIQMVTGENGFDINRVAVFNDGLSDPHYTIITKTDSGLVIENNDDVGNVKETHTHFQKKMNMLRFKHGSNIIKNLDFVCIDGQGNLRLTKKHAFRVYINEASAYSRIILETNRSDGEKKVESAYTNLGGGIGEFLFPDGSKIIKDSKGILTLISSDSRIPKIYIPSSVQFNLGVYSNYEYAGNRYFLSAENEGLYTEINIEEFDRKYIKPFIKTIVEYGA